jgi:hypothetical protein
MWHDAAVIPEEGSAMQHTRIGLICLGLLLVGLPSAALADNPRHEGMKLRARKKLHIVCTRTEQTVSARPTIVNIGEEAGRADIKLKVVAQRVGGGDQQTTVSVKLADNQHFQPDEAQHFEGVVELPIRPREVVVSVLAKDPNKGNFDELRDQTVQCK